MRLSLLIFWIFLGLTSCADSLKYSMANFAGFTSSIERSSDEMISVSQPFKPDLSLNTEKEYESITWEKVSGPGDIIFSSLNTLNPNISANKTGKYQAKITILFKDGTSEEKVISFEWLQLDKEAPEAFSITSPTSMQLMPANLAINWQKAKDPSPVTYEVSILDQSCSTEVYSKEVKNALTHTVPLNSLNVASTYCLKIEARDLPGNRTKASNNSLLFKTAAPHTLNAGADIVVKERTTLSAAASSGNDLSYNWTSTTGVQFSDPSALNPEVEIVAPATDGVYTLTLTSTDAFSGSVLTDSLQLTWDQTAPVIVTIPNEARGAPFTLTASVSDATSGISNVIWEDVNNTGELTFSSPNTLSTGIQSSASIGSYTISFSAVDNSGNTVSETFTLTWDTTVLTANAGTDIKTNSPVTLSGSSNGDNYAWTGTGVTITDDTTLSPTVNVTGADGTYAVHSNYESGITGGNCKRYDATYLGYHGANFFLHCHTFWTCS